MVLRVRANPKDHADDRHRMFACTYLRTYAHMHI